MPRIHIHHRQISDGGSNDLLEIRFAYWDAPEHPNPSFKLTYSADDSDHPGFSPTEDAPGQRKNPRIWVARVEQRHFTGRITARAWCTNDTSGTPDGETTFDAGIITSPAGAAASPQQIRLAISSPQLCLTINAQDTKLPAPTLFSGTATTPTHVVDICRYLLQVMCYASEFAWEMTGSRYLGYQDPRTLSPEDMEECWSQTITEALLGLPYAGSPTIVGMQEPGTSLFGRMTTIDDPVIPIVAACQHLCTIALVSRGFDAIANNPVDSHGNAIENLTSIIGGHFSSATRYRDPTLAQNDLFLERGGIYHFSQSPHVAFILRSFANGRIQFFDTGAMCSPSSPLPPQPPNSINPPHLVPNISGNLDYPWFPETLGRQVEGPNSTPKVYKGLFLPPPAAFLATGIDRLRRSRPLGLARLVLRDRTIGDMEDSLLFATPLLPMWEQGGFPFTLFRLMFGLRNHPYCDRIEARWLIDVPRNQLTTDMLASRDFAGTWSGRNRMSRTTTMGVLDLASRPDGTVEVAGRYYTSPIRRNNPDPAKQWGTAEYWSTPSGPSVISFPTDADHPQHNGRPMPRGGRPASLDALPIGRTPSPLHPSGMDGLLAEYETYTSSHPGGPRPTYPNKVIMGASGLDVPPYFLGTPG